MMIDGATVERAAFAAGLRAAIAPVMGVAEWADRYRVLSKGSSSEPGRWSTARTPYLREIMDCLSADNPVQDVVLQKSTQIGGTECGNNWIGSIMHQGLGPTMIVLPTSSAAKKASKTRIAPMVADVPELRARVRDAKSRDSGNTTLLKEFDGGVLILAGANSATELKSSPVRNIFLDEIDEYPADVDGQGDPEELATKRSDTFARQKRLKVSTPTNEGGRIDAAYQASDQRRYYVPCPHCAHEQTLRWEQLRWETRKVWEVVRADDGEVVQVEPNADGAVERDTRELLDVWYECEGCAAKIYEHYKTRMLNAGRWIAHNPGPDRAAGFHINALYSPIGWFGWRKAVLAWFRAQEDTSGLKKKTFHNTVLGLANKVDGETIDEHWLKGRVETWRLGSRVPAGALALCAGCDVQGDRLEVYVWGYGRDYESWLVDWHVIHGSPALEETWTALDALLARAWVHELGGKLRIEQLAIDGGDGNTTHFVRAWVRRWAVVSRRVICTKGQAVQGKPLLGRPSDQDVHWRGGVIKNGVKMWPLGSDTGKAAFYARLRLEKQGPGFVHLPTGLPEDIFAQLTAERMQTRLVRGHPVHEWHLPRGRRNEALDCRVMADAAAERWGIRRAPWDRIEASLRAAARDLFESPVTDDAGTPASSEEAAPIETMRAAELDPAIRALVAQTSARRPSGRAPMRTPRREGW